MGSLLPALEEIETLLVAPTEGLQVCHRDVWADNAGWVGEFLDDPVTVPVVETPLDAVR